MRDVLISISREFQGKVNTHVAFSIVRAYECEKYMFYVIQNFLLYVYNGTAPCNRIFSSRDSVIIHCREEGRSPQNGTVISRGCQIKVTSF